MKFGSFFKTCTHIFLAFMLTAIIQPSHLSAQSVSCGITEVTFAPAQTGHGHPSISHDGTRIAFWSQSDLTGDNPDLNAELFLYNSETSVTNQLTNTIGGWNFSPLISGDGKKIAFVSEQDFGGGNPDGSTELFLLDLDSAAITQLTSGTIGNVLESIDDTGATVSFYSWDNYVGNNADNTIEIFVKNISTNQIIQVTTSNSGGFAHGGSDVSGNGEMLAFGSHLNLTGSDPDGKYDVFIYDIAAATLSQLSPLGDQAIPGTWNADGTRYLFFSDGYATGFGAPNPEANFELFLYNALNNSVQMLTDTGASEFNGHGTLSSDGSRISFLSNKDWTGGNADLLPEVFLLDLNSGITTQVTDTDNYEIQYPKISGNGEKIAFVSNQFAELGNADASYEIFLAECLPPPSSDLSVSLGVDRTSVKQGDKITYTVTLRNFGPNDAHNVVVNDLISSGATFVSANANKGTFNTPPVGQSGVVAWNVGALSNNAQESAQIKVTVILKGKGTVMNTATVSSSISDPNLANNSATITINLGSGGGKK